MPTTMDLYARALTIKRQAAWARQFNITEGALSTAKKRGRLSPTLAGILASELQEDPVRWSALAALEAEPDSPLRARLMKTLARTWHQS